LKNFRILTLFPDYFHGPLEASLLGKAVKNQVISVDLVNIRNFGIGKHKQVDDTPYGGGPGMVMMVEPLARALDAIKNPVGYTVIMAARGKKVTQQDFLKLARLDQPINIICGHYEGVDERVGESLCDEQLCVGPYVLSGGEPAAMILIDGISRLLPGFMHNHKSIIEESFSTPEYTEYPQYTRPAEFSEWKVPDVLLSGNHAEIKKWRAKNSKSTNKDLLQDNNH
jgi:tRNA (guanine37-N1)-methyltransferase